MLDDINVGVHVFSTGCLAFITTICMLPYYRPGQFEKAPWVAAPGDGHWTDTTHATSVSRDSQETGAPKPKEALLLPRNNKQPSPKRSPLRAVWDVVNVSDVAVAVCRGIKLLFGRPRLPKTSAFEPSRGYVPVAQGGEAGEELPTYRRT
jgi:hypothetical protein